MRPVTTTRAVVAGILGAAAFLCAFGFIASFEPAPRAVQFRVGYAIAGALALLGAAGALFKR